MYNEVECSYAPLPHTQAQEGLAKGLLTTLSLDLYTVKVEGEMALVRIVAL